MHVCTFNICFHPPWECSLCIRQIQHCGIWGIYTYLLLDKHNGDEHLVYYSDDANSGSEDYSESSEGEYSENYSQGNTFCVLSITVTKSSDADINALEQNSAQVKREDRICPKPVVIAVHMNRQCLPQVTRNLWCFQNRSHGYGYGSALWHTATYHVPIPWCHGYVWVLL